MMKVILLMIIYRNEMLKVQYEKSFSKPVASAVIEDANAFFTVEESYVFLKCILLPMKQ